MTEDKTARKMIVGQDIKTDVRDVQTSEIVSILESMCDTLYTMTEDQATWLPIQQRIFRLKEMLSK